MTKKKSERQHLIAFVKWLNKERVCGCVQLVPESVVTVYFWDRLPKDIDKKPNSDDLLEGNKF